MELLITRDESKFARITGGGPSVTKDGLMSMPE